MKFDENISKYLDGILFSNSLKIKVGNSEKSIISRFDKLIELASNKNILHLGFADHIPLIEGKIKDRKWLHGLLVNVANKCVGIDTNAEAIDFIKSKFNIGEIYVHDIINDPQLEIITSEKWDYLVTGEVLEHIDNPVQFLRSIKERYGGHIDKIVITVPNAFDLQNIKLLKNNIEFINSDHRYWFTPFTLAKVCTRAGYKIDEFWFCQSYIPSNPLDKYLLRRKPIFREGILMILTNDIR